MILVTVGTQIPFDRLMHSVEKWLDKSENNFDVVAQVGASDYLSDKFETFKSVEPDQFERYIEECDFIISHAGMGSILTALRVKKPIIIFPRQAKLGEHRNDHQLATARAFSNIDGVYVALSEGELFSILDSNSEFSSGILNDSDEYIKLLSNVSCLL